MKQIFKVRSKLLFILASLESILALWALCYFNYIDRLNYIESINHNTLDLALLIQNMYTSTWWALLILIFILVSIFAFTSFIFKDEKFQFINIFLWVFMLILAINIKDSLVNNVSTIFIFAPIIMLNFLAYYYQKKINSKS